MAHLPCAGKDTGAITPRSGPEKSDESRLEQGTIANAVAASAMVIPSRDHCSVAPKLLGRRRAREGCVQALEEQSLRGPSSTADQVSACDLTDCEYRIRSLISEARGIAAQV